MGAGMKLIAGFAVILAAIFAWGGSAAASPLPNLNPWLETQAGVLNMAHQGGEFEAPSSTMYAFRTALEDRGADSLELDVNLTADDRLAVMHDYYTWRITPQDHQVRDLTLAELQDLDAAYWYSPGTGQFDHAKPAGEYPLRGVRTGGKAPPPGFGADDFRVPLIEEVLAAFPQVPINIEIKSVPGEPAVSIRAATLLAEILNRPENAHRRYIGARGLIVASLDQDALATLHVLAPQTDLSASITAMIGFIGAGTPIVPNPVALQVPMAIGEMEVPRVLQEMGVKSKGYAVHAWTDGAGTENDLSYAKLIDSGVQGIISSSPSVLHDYLCRAGIRRPDRSPRCAGQRLAYSLKMPGKKLRKLPLRGLPVKVTCDQACGLGLSLDVRPKVARRLGFKVRGSIGPDGLVNIATGSRPSGERPAGTHVFRTYLNSVTKRRLPRLKKAAILLRVTVFDSGSWKAATRSRWIQLQKPKGKRG